jgi:AcrR family transcriptional regulator
MSPRAAAQLEQLKEERRRSVLRAARHVFARRGFMAAKISDMAAEAGISHGLIHHYFPGKDALFSAVVEESVQDWESLVTRIRREPGTPWERLVSLCSQMVKGVYDEPEHLLVIVHAFTEDAPRAVRESLERYNRQVRENLAMLIEEGQRTGAVAPGVPEELARALIALVQGLAISRVVNPSGPLPLIEIVLRVLKA